MVYFIETNGLQPYAGCFSQLALRVLLVAGRLSCIKLNTKRESSFSF